MMIFLNIYILAYTLFYLILHTFVQVKRVVEKPENINETQITTDSKK